MLVDFSIVQCASVKTPICVLSAIYQQINVYHSDDAAAEQQQKIAFHFAF